MFRMQNGGLGGMWISWGVGAIANIGMSEYLVCSINPSTESIPLKYHDLIRCISPL
jgi:hypothetical protein